MTSYSGQKQVSTAALRTSSDVRGSCPQPTGQSVRTFRNEGPSAAGGARDLLAQVLPVHERRDVHARRAGRDARRLCVRTAAFEAAVGLGDRLGLGQRGASSSKTGCSAMVAITPSLAATPDPHIGAPTDRRPWKGAAFGGR